MCSKFAQRSSLEKEKDMKLSHLIVASFVLLAVNTPAFGAQQIKDCGLGATREIEDALGFIHSNLETIMTNVGDLTNNEKDRLRRKIDRVNIKCKDHRRVCRNATRGGISRHLFDAAVVVCYNNVRDIMGGQAFCSLADVIVHEIAHTANVSKDHGHNDGPNGDRVYRTGNAARLLCRVQGLDGTIVRNTND